MRTLLALVLLFVVFIKVYANEPFAKILRIDGKCTIQDLVRQKKLPRLRFNCPKQGGDTHNFSMTTRESLGKLQVGSTVRVVADVEVLSNGTLRPIQVHVFSNLINSDGLLRFRVSPLPGALNRGGSLLRQHRKESDYMVF